MHPLADLLRFRQHKTLDDVDRVLARLVRNAGRRVPFYRELFRTAEIDAASFRGVRSLASLPPSSREAFQEPPERNHLLEGTHPLRCTRTSTSGSTGKPLTIYFSRPEMYFRRLSVLAGLRHYASLRLPLRVADIGSMVPYRERNLEQRLGAVSILRIPGTMPLEEQRACILQYRPTVLEGYPTCLGTLAESFSESDAKRIRPLLVATRGERLREDTREVLRRTFRVPVANLYNCEEVGNVGWECPDHPGRFHLNRDTCVLEVLDSGGKPTEGDGDVAITNLYNHTVPFLRYLLDDRGRLAGDASAVCPCGAAAPWLEGLSGSDDDFVSIPDGRRILPAVLPNALFNALRMPGSPHRLSPSVRRYQIVQEEDYSLRVILDWRGPHDPVLWQQITSGMTRACHGLRLSVERTGAFELTPAGKFKEVLSRVRRPTPS